MWPLLIWSNLDDPLMPGLRSRTTAPTCPWAEELWVRAELAPSQMKTLISTLHVPPGQQHDVLLAPCPQYLNSGTSPSMSTPSSMDIHGHLPTQHWWPWDLTYHHALYGLAVVCTLPSLEITLRKSHSLKRLRHQLVETG